MGVTNERWFAARAQLVHNIRRGFSVNWHGCPFNPNHEKFCSLDAAKRNPGVLEPGIRFAPSGLQATSLAFHVNAEQAGETSCLPPIKLQNK